MFIDSVDNRVIVELGVFDIENTEIEFGDDFIIDKLKLPMKYKNIDNELLSNIKQKMKGEIEYYD